jgi:PST family polysaccharide transporter
MTAAFVASDLVRGVIGFATSVIIARGLGRDEFGRWTLYATWASALTMMFDLGFGVLLTREAARGGRVGAIVGGAVVARLALFTPVALALAVFGAGRWAIPDASVQTTYLVLATAAAGMAYGCLAAVYRASPAWLAVILIVETVGTLTQSVGSAFIIVGGGSIPALLRLALAVQLAQLGVATIGWHTVSPEDRVHLPSLRSIGQLVWRGVPFAMTGLVANIQSRMGAIVLGVAATPADVAAFGVAQRLEGAARRLPSAACGAALPVLTGDIERTGETPVRARFDGALRWFALGAAAALVVGARPIVRYTYGDAFEGAWAALSWAAIGLVPSLTNAGRKVYLYASGRETIVLRWSAIACAIQAIGCAALIPRFGAVGAMAAYVAAEAAIWLPLRRSANGVSARTHDRAAPLHPTAQACAVGTPALSRSEDRG